MSAVSCIDFRTPANGFEQPIEMWLATHTRIARMNSMLQRLVDFLRKNPVDVNAGVTAASLRRYFDEAVQRHHEDEEIDLFPRLLDRLNQKSSGPAAEHVGAAIQALLSDHDEMDDLWATLRAQLLLIEAGKDPGFDDTQVMLFVTRYRAHMEIEDNEIAPALKRMLDARDLQEIGQAMAARRGVDWEDFAAASP
jgi:hemerythrin-like domain-containing protein